VRDVCQPIREAISFERVRGYDELATIVLVILPFNSSSERLPPASSHLTRPIGLASPTNRHTCSFLTTLHDSHVQYSSLLNFSAIFFAASLITEEEG
jgi:hypothetical protein